MTRIAFRMDDVTPEMDQERFRRFQRLFDRHGIKPLIGVVPDNRDPKLKISPPDPGFWEAVRVLQSAGWSVGQHGCHHVYETSDGGILGVKPQSEFAALPYEVQHAKIEAGKKRLQEHGVDADIWVAPGHSYDSTTLKALHNLGFGVVSDGFSLFPYEHMGLRFVPSQFGFPRKPPFGVATIYIHSNMVDEAEFEKYARFVERHRDSICDFADLLALPVHNKSRALLEPAALLLRRLKRRR